MVSEPENVGASWAEYVRQPSQLTRDRRAMDPLTQALEHAAGEAEPGLTRQDVAEELGVSAERPLDCYAAALAEFLAFLETQPEARDGLLADLEARGPGSWDVPGLERLALILDVLATHWTAHLPSRAGMRRVHAARSAARLRADFWTALGRLHARAAAAGGPQRFRPRTDRPPLLDAPGVVLCSAPRHAPPASARSARIALA